MFVQPEDRRWGEEPAPRKEFIRSSRGYPETRDPAADGRQQSPLSGMKSGDEHRLRLKYGPARVM